MHERLPPPSSAPDAWETVPDADEQLFTVSMPRGWRNRAWVQSNGSTPVQLVKAESPSGETALFLSDPTIPQFLEPAAVVFSPPPGVVVRPYTSIEYFLPFYAQQRFGGLPGFKPGAMAPSPELFQWVAQAVQRSGAQAGITAGRLAFSFNDGPRRVQALLFGACMSFGPVWFADVHGISTVGDPEAFVPALLEMMASRRTNPAVIQRQLQERARSAAQHQATMASIHQNTALLQSQHQQNMAALRGMAASHQAHMASLHASHDAHNAAWQSQQATQAAAHSAQMHASDDSHRRFLNAISEERTVIDSEGNTHQVADGYDRYFRRRSDGAWIGTRDHRDLSGLPGVNPNDYEEVKIKV
jgi:hypothetical protein